MFGSRTTVKKVRNLLTWFSQKLHSKGMPRHSVYGNSYQLQHTEDAYRAAHLSWMDLEVAPDDITQWQEANDNRMQFKVGNCKDSNIRMLTGTIKADWIQLSVPPNDLSLDQWCAGVYVLPTVAPDVSMLGASNLRRVIGDDFHRLRNKYEVPSMWGNPPTMATFAKAWLVPAL